MRFLSTSSATLALLIGTACLPAYAYNVQILDDYGNAYPDLNLLYTAHGDNVSPLTHDFGATDLTGDRLVITNVPSGYSSAEIANLVSYVGGGGRLVLGSEFNTFSQASINATNSALAALGSSIVNNSNEYDAGFQTTTSILSNTFTQGVGSIDYAAYSSLSGGTPLVNGVAGPSLVAYQKIGLGYVFVIGDSNLAGEVNDPTFGNGQLFLNFENAGATAVSAVPLPASAPLFGAALLGLGAVGYGMNRKKNAVSA